MSPGRKEIIAENLATAAAIGILALAVAIAGSAADARESAGERAALAALTRRSVALEPAELSGPSGAARFHEAAFQRVYRIEGKGPRLYGSVITLDSIRGASRIAVALTARGELNSVDLLASSSSLLPFARDGWFKEFLGTGWNDRALAYSAVSPLMTAEEVSCRAKTRDALARLSATIASLEKVPR
ncbi:MAG: hypothetical protein Q8M76_06505 [Spirochaetaceae bacterium]|nr:hypothetical protein [Spirochaetaceae bacterium]